MSDYYYPQLGGVTEHVHGQATELARRGHEVTVITPGLVKVPRTVDADVLPPETFEVIRLGRALSVLRQPGRGARQLVTPPRSSLDRLFDERRFDVVHVHNPIGPWLADHGRSPLAAPR